MLYSSLFWKYFSGIIFTTIAMVQGITKRKNIPIIVSMVSFLEGKYSAFPRGIKMLSDLFFWEFEKYVHND
jgi:hypothetical protein